MTEGQSAFEAVKFQGQQKRSAAAITGRRALPPVGEIPRSLPAVVGCQSGRHRGIITRTAESVFEALLYLTEKYGRVFLSLEGLAYLAMCCKQSVVTALADLERLGFLTRIRRIRRISTPLPRPGKSRMPTACTSPRGGSASSQ
jgi:hypothetical protein